MNSLGYAIRSTLNKLNPNRRPSVRELAVETDGDQSSRAQIGPKGRVLYVGHCYYSNWYISRALRKIGWKADTLNTSSVPAEQMYFHGEDFKFRYSGRIEKLRRIRFYFRALRNYDIFHFYGMFNIRLFTDHDVPFSRILPKYWEIKLLRMLGKKIVYTHTGCLDGVSQSSFRAWDPGPICDSCVWRDRPDVCSDDKNLAWGRLRNSLADFQVTVGANRRDYNIDPTVNETPQFYCLDPDFWRPDLLVPTNYRLPMSEDTVKVYHSVGNFETRSSIGENRNLKSTHIYLPVIDRLKAEGANIEMVFFNDVPNRVLRYYQVQADIVVDMLTYGWFGANVREAMMLGKPVVCYIRPEWLESVRQEIPVYADELPVINATPSTVYEVLKDLIENPEKRREIGSRSREFAVKWHSAEAGAARMDQVYSELLAPSVK